MSSAHLEAALIAGSGRAVPFWECKILSSFKRSSGLRDPSICFPVNSGLEMNAVAILLLKSALAAVSGLNARCAVWKILVVLYRHSNLGSIITATLTLSPQNISMLSYSAANKIFCTLKPSPTRLLHLMPTRHGPARCSDRKVHHISAHVSLSFSCVVMCGHVPA